jgi:hypothetical protein
MLERRCKSLATDQVPRQMFTFLSVAAFRPGTANHPTGKNVITKRKTPAELIHIMCDVN